MDSSGSDRDFLTVAETARELGRSTEQVRRYLREGRLNGRRMGGQWFIDREAVRGFSNGKRKEERFSRRLRPASRQTPLDDVIGIGHGPGSNIAQGRDSYRMDALRNR